MPLHAAVSTGNELVVDILLAANADPFALNGKNSSCVDLAHANFELKDKFVKLGVQPSNPVGAHGRSTLRIMNIAAALSQLREYNCELAY